MKISFLQLNLVAGDLEGNAKTIVSALKKAASEGSELCLTPELALIGYNISDSLLYPSFQNRLLCALDLILSECDKIALILGSIAQKNTTTGKILLNQALLLEKGRIEASWEKHNLGRHEQRYFVSGQQQELFEWRGKKLALSIGNDLFALPKPDSADLLINIAANPYNAAYDREKALSDFAANSKTPLLYINAVGACDSFIYSGQSSYIQQNGTISARAKAFTEEILSFNLEQAGPLSPPIKNREEGIFQALCLGLKDYCRKSGISQVILGLSGGIDSALVAAIACHALGSENVLGLLMPSPWSSEHSLTDAQALAANLKMKTLLIPITNLMDAFTQALAPAFAGKAKDVTEENLQARIRAVLLMAMANKFRAMVLATGNKSEISVGYSTLYGDMCGALEPIGDLYKTEVYEICHWINKNFDNVIPKNILTKAPSAELAPGQKDEDSLPPYSELDPMLRGMLDQRLALEILEKQGFARENLLKVARLVSIAQFKREQAPPILHVFDSPSLDMPISGKFPFI